MSDRPDLSDVTEVTGVVDVGDRFATARTVADAVLYEGYVLYPYRASSRKNQVRFQWGVLTPRLFAEAEGSERWSMRTECLVEPGVGTGAVVEDEPVIHVRIRCLQAQHRSIEGTADGGDFAPVDYLEIDGTLHVDWDEAVDQVVDLAPLSLSGDAELAETFSFPGGTRDRADHLGRRRRGWSVRATARVHRRIGAVGGRTTRCHAPLPDRVGHGREHHGLDGRWPAP